MNSGRFIRLSGAVALVCLVGLGSTARAQSVRDLKTLSIAELANIDVTSVSKRSEPISGAAAAIYVITHDEIVRSGATTIPQILRLAPNLQVAHITQSSAAITARGFNGNAADKLLVLIDGRSVYTPLFGGVLWDEQDVPVDDIERVEVISGPGATLWGANAVNGVINIITRKAGETQGASVDFGGGTRMLHGTVQYGGRIGKDVAYRVYADALTIRSGRTSLGTDAEDGWWRGQGGFRVDWTPGADQVTIKGDLYRGSEQQPAAPRLHLSGGTLRASWTHELADGSSLQLLAYHDESQRTTRGGAGYTLQANDLEMQHSFSLGARHTIVWGAGLRVYHDHFRNAGNVAYLPASSTKLLADVFAHDTVTLTPALDLVVGLKLEKDPYAGVEPLPTARLSWKIGDDVLLWGAISRAVRAPTIFDEDLHDTIVPGVLVLTGNKDFKTEKLTAFELGTRVQLDGKASFSVSGFYHVYDDLRSVEWARQDRLPLTIQWGNMMEGDIYGVEAWGDYQVAPWWRLSAGFKLQHKDLRFKPGASAVNNVGAAGDDPDAQGSIRSSISLGRSITWHAALRYVGRLPNQNIPSYIEADSNLSWAVGPKLRLSLTGFNLLHAHHLEYELAGATSGNLAERSVLLGAHVRF